MRTKCKPNYKATNNYTSEKVKGWCMRSLILAAAILAKSPTILKWQLSHRETMSVPRSIRWWPSWNELIALPFQGTTTLLFQDKDSWTSMQLHFPTWLPVFWSNIKKQSQKASVNNLQTLQLSRIYLCLLHLYLVHSNIHFQGMELSKLDTTPLDPCLDHLTRSAVGEQGQDWLRDHSDRFFCLA